jgi:hypothetical protein
MALAGERSEPSGPVSVTTTHALFALNDRGNSCNLSDAA